MSLHQVPSATRESSGHVQSCWSVATLTTFLATRFRLVLARASVRRYLKVTRWRWARPRLAPARKTDPQTIDKEAAIAAALTRVAPGWGHLLNLDECDLHLLPMVRALGMKKALPAASHLLMSVSPAQAICGILAHESPGWSHTGPARGEGASWTSAGSPRVQGRGTSGRGQRAGVANTPREQAACVSTIIGSRRRCMDRERVRWDRDFGDEESAHDLVKDAWERGLPFEQYADLIVAHYRQAHSGGAPDGLRERILAAMTREAAALGAEAPRPSDRGPSPPPSARSHGLTFCRQGS